MHFRLYRDVELGMGSWRARDDFLGLQLDNNGNRVPSLAATSSSSTTTAMLAHGEGVRSPQVEEDDKVNDDSQRQYPKRVSLTAEDNASMAPSETSSVDGNETPEEGNGDAASPLRVAEILRQMSQAGSPKAPEAPALTKTPVAAENKKTATIEREAFRKRSVPPTFLPTAGCAAQQGPKRVRWMPPTTAPAPPAARFFHNMPQGITAANAMSMALTHHQLPTVPVLKPIPGLEAYDVLIRRDFISHFNLGNRRLLVLAFSHLDKFLAAGVAKPEGQQVIIESLYNAIRSAGGRFVEMVGQRGGFEEMTPFAAKLAIASVLHKQGEHYQSGKGLIRMFQRDCASIWGNVQDDQDNTMKAAATAAAPKEGDLQHSPVDESYDSADEDTTSDDEKERPYRKTVKKFEPMTPLAIDFEPGQYDVICSRGSLPKKHAGNIWFVSLVEQNCERYIQAEGKMAKSIIVSEILDIVRKNSPGGGFVKMDDDGRWCETGDHLAREKIGQCFRDRLHTRYSSSSKAKLEKRRSSKCDTGSVGSMDREDESN